jgi:hypothetical protein
MQITVTTEDGNIVSVDVDPETIVENLKASQPHHFSRPPIPDQPDFRLSHPRFRPLTHPEGPTRSPLHYTLQRRPHGPGSRRVLCSVCYAPWFPSP